jgi:hypothetical protein
MAMNTNDTISQELNQKQYMMKRLKTLIRNYSTRFAFENRNIPGREILFDLC